MEEEEAHKIRLQVHLVGNRPWDAYSKSKYLHELVKEYKMPMAELVSYCGGSKSDVLQPSRPTTDYATVLVRQALKQIPSVRERVLASQFGSDSVARLDMVETKLNDFIAEPNYCPFGDMPPSDVGDYQKMFQALATVSSSPRTAKELMAGILLLASGAEKDGMERGGTVC